MLGISLFGVTPGYTKRDFSIESKKLAPVIQACSELYLLDQFSVSVPSEGTLHVLGGRIVRHQAVSFIGRYRHAVELGGNRDGGHYGAGIWMVDEWLDGKDVTSAIDRMMALVRERMIDEAGRFIRTFEQVDWSDVRALLDDLDQCRIGPPDGRRDPAPEHRFRKLLLMGAPDDTGERSIVDIIRSLGNRWAMLTDRVIYVSFDRAVVDAIRRLNRIEITTFEQLKTEDVQRQTRRNSPPKLDDKEPVETPKTRFHDVQDQDDDHDRFARITVPIRNDENRPRPRNERAESQPSGKQGLRNFQWSLFSTRTAKTSDAWSTRDSATFSSSVSRRALIGCAALASVLLSAVLIGNGGDWFEAAIDMWAPGSRISSGMRPSKTSEPEATELPLRAAGTATPKDHGSPTADMKVGSVSEPDKSNPTTRVDRHELEMLCIYNINGSDLFGQETTSINQKLQTVEEHITKILQAGDRSGSLSRKDLEIIGLLIAREKTIRECIREIH